MEKLLTILSFSQRRVSSHREGRCSRVSTVEFPLAARRSSGLINQHSRATRRPGRRTRSQFSQTQTRIGWCGRNIHKTALLASRRALRESLSESSLAVFPSVEVFPQFRSTHNAERTYAHPVGCLLPVPLSRSRCAPSHSLFWSLTFASLLLGPLLPTTK